jgi:hypothetical protein
MRRRVHDFPGNPHDRIYEPYGLLVLLPLDQLDRPFDHIGVEILGLLPRQLDILKRGGDLVVGQKPLLKAIRDEPLQFPGVGRTRSRPKLSAEKSCVSYGFDLPLRDGAGGPGTASPKPDYFLTGFLIHTRTPQRQPGAYFPTEPTLASLLVAMTWSMIPYSRASSAVR